MIALDACVKKTFFTAPNMGTPKRRKRLGRGRKRPRFGRDGRTTQSISRSLDHRSKPNRRGCALCSLIPVGVVWLSCTIPNSHELDGGVCTSCQLKLFVGGSTNQSLFKCNRGTKKAARKKQPTTTRGASLRRLRAQLAEPTCSEREHGTESTP